jgi:ABC-type antimicrobial peptide transport system permease subunit
MLINYFKIAFRNIWKHKVFSMINIAGLAIGISAALVIYLIIEHDLGFDKFQPGGERIYRVVSEMKFPGQLIKNPGVPSPLPVAMKKDLAGIENISGFQRYNNDIKVKVPVPGTETYKEFRKQNDIIFADDQYFKLIPYVWVTGSPEALKEPNTCVLTLSKSTLYFPGIEPESVIGKTLVYDDSVNMTVKGIVKDIQESTDFNFTAFLSYITIPGSNLKENYGWDEWNSVSSSSQAFIKVTPGTSVAVMEKKILEVHQQHAKDNKDMDVAYKLQPLSDIHFNQDLGTFGPYTAHMPTLAGLSLVAVFLLLLACINFINLNTAQSGSRAREIGIRKTLGSSRSQLVSQFLGETLIIIVLAAVLSLVLAPLILKIFADFIPSGIHLSLTEKPGMAVFMALLIITMTLLSGFYPSMVLSSFKPIQVMKSSSAGTGSSHRLWLRKTLTVSQFVIAQFLLISTIIVVKQIRFSTNKDMGFNKEAIINLRVPWNVPDSAKKQALYQKLATMPEIQAVAIGGSPPAANGYNTTTMSYMAGSKKYETMVEVKSGDAAYLELYRLPLLAGRYPSSTTGPDKELLINKTFASFLGFKNPADAVGISILKNEQPTPVVGVLADFHTQSTRSAIKPLSFSIEKRRQMMFHIKLYTGENRSEKWTSAIHKMEKAWKEIYPDNDFTYSFLDEDIAKFYKSEQNISKLLTWASGLCIFISCLGLLGLVMHTTRLRTKEIGVRKVLGASIKQIISLLSTDFLRLIILAFIIASPLAWWAMHSWLNNFAFRTSLNWWVFVISGVMMLLAALATMGILTFKAANANPVKSLRTE